MNHPEITYVDDKDTVIGQGSMQDAWKHGHIHRIVRLFVFNSKGAFLLQKRSMNHANMPGKWDNSAAGHVDAGEEYKAAVLREANEEIGVQDINVREICSYYKDETEGGKYKKRFQKLYETTYEGEIVFDESEVSEVRWIDSGLLQNWMTDKPDDFAPGFLDAWNRYILSKQAI
jgi:16S rRNA (adenine1518-N6/adenine1519-N6)-dimethyltransferase